MNPIVYHIVSGQSFFTGVGLVLIVVFLSTQKHRLAHRVAFVLFAVGILALVLSSTPIPYCYYALLIVTTLYWLLTLKRSAAKKRASAGMVIVWLGAAAMEMPWHFGPRPIAASSSGLTIVGDSVSAGMEEREAETWPSLLARQHQITIQDLSHVGETARSALKRVQQRGIQFPVILLEIGGNDLLGSTTSTEFEADLDALLQYLKQPNHEILMFELPLPPMLHEFGRIQRLLAMRYGVRLIPKRIFLSIIYDGDSTVDSIHLSQSGHQRMAELVWSLVQPAGR